MTETPTIESLASRLEDLQSNQAATIADLKEKVGELTGKLDALQASVDYTLSNIANTFDVVTIWLTGFGILTAIVIAIAGYLMVTQRKELQDLQKKGIAEVKKEAKEEIKRHLEKNSDKKNDSYDGADITGQ